MITSWSKFILILVSLICVTNTLEQVNTQYSYQSYLQLHSTYPVVHVFYNRYFKKTRQFNDFIQVVEQTELKVRDYAKFMITNCQQAKDENFQACKYLQQNNENRVVTGLKPNSQFLSLQKKKLQRSPEPVTMGHPTDIYTIQQFQDFIDGLIPSYLDQISTLQELKQFLNPRYAPKLIYFTKEEEPTLNIKKLSVVYNLRFDFAYAEDLSQEIINEYKIKKFPTLMILKFNYETKNFQKIIYEGNQFDHKGFLQMKDFLSNYGLKNPRTDVLFHTITPITTQLITVDNEQDLWRFYDSANAWVITQQSPKPTTIIDFKTKYGNYFNYLHIKSQKTPAKLSLYTPDKNESYPITNDLLFNSLKAEQFVGNVSLFIKQNYLILGVRQKYSHLCGITLQAFFRGIVQCFILSEKGYDQFSKKMSLEFDYAFFSFNSPAENQQQQQKAKVQKINSATYSEVYKTLQYFTKSQLQKLMQQFINKPIKQVKLQKFLTEVCHDPRKKCVIAFLDSSKPQVVKTELGYLKDVAQNYYSDYNFYWVDKSCNYSLLKNYFGDTKTTLVVYNPRENNYAGLKQKLNKNIANKFLKKAHRQKNIFKSLNNKRDLIVNKCRENQDL